MSDEIRTAADLRASIVDQRGGIERFDGPQRRLLDALVFELAKKPNEIDVRVVTDLMAMLPRPVSAPESSRDDRDATVAPLLKLFRHLHESVHTLSAENARLRAALGRDGIALPSPNVGSGAITPGAADITPPSEIGSDCYAGMRPGADDPPRRSTQVIEAKAVRKAPVASAPAKPEPWQAWLDAQQGGHGFDRWSNRNIP